MNETGVYDFKLEYTFAGDYMAELDRQLALCCPRGRAPCRWIGSSA